MTVDGISGDDTLTVVGTTAGENITVNPDSGTNAIQIGSLQAVNDLNNVDALTVLGQEGADSFNVTPSLTVPISLDGGDPNGSGTGDSLTVNVLGREITGRIANLREASWDRIVATLSNAGESVPPHFDSLADAVNTFEKSGSELKQ